MKSIRKYFAVALVATLAGGLLSCGQKNTSQTTAPSQSQQAGAKTVINYWSTNRHDKTYIDQKIKEFNDSNEKIEIKYEVYADNYAQMLDLAFQTDSAPDIFQLTEPVRTVHAKGYLMPLNSYADEEYLKRFDSGYFVDGVNMIGEELFTLPYTASEVRLFYNQDIFDKVGITAPPKTLDELVDYSKKITDQLKGEGIYAFAANYKSPASSVARTIDAIVQVSGGTRQGFDFKNGKYDFSSYKPVLEKFSEIFAGGYAFPGSESLDIDPLRTQFAAGKIAMYMSITHAEPGVYATQFPTEQNWNVAQVPTVDGEVKGLQQLWFGGAAFGINKNSKNPAQAWEVFQYIHSDSVMKGYFEAGLGDVMIKTAKESAKAPEMYAKMPNLEMNIYDKNWPALPTNIVVEGKSYAEVIVSVIFGQTEIDAAIEDLNTRYNAAYDKAVAAGQTRIQFPKFDPLNQDLSK